MDEKRIAEIEKRASKDAYSWAEAEKLLQDIPDLLAEVKRLRSELADGVRYVNALVDGMTADQFNALVDAGKVNGIAAWLDLNGEVINV